MTPEFYVLHYNTKTSEYGNEIVFKHFENAMHIYREEKPHNGDDRVELVYSPIKGDNIVIISKGAFPISINDTKTYR